MSNLSFPSLPPSWTGSGTVVKLEPKRKPGSSLKLGDVVPDFSADSTAGRIDFHEWLGGSWAMLFSHPADFTPVCTTEIGCVEEINDRFAKRGVKLVALSCDSVESHLAWIEDIKEWKKLGGVSFPIVADPTREIAVSFGMIDPDEKDAAGLPLTCRSVFIIGPDAKLKLAILYPATTGRNFNEVLRAIDSLQLTANLKVATPVDWKEGDRCMVIPSMSTEEARDNFGEVTVHQMPSGKEYIRTVPPPA